LKTQPKPAILAHEARPGAGLDFGVPASGERPFSAVVTLVIWSVCLLVGIVGLTVPYPPNPYLRRKEPPISVRTFEAELTPTPPPPEVSPSLEPGSEAPPPPDDLASPVLSQPVAVASPLANVSFALPVEGPVRVVDPRRAGYSKSPPPRNTNAAPVTAPVVKKLEFGVGEGRKPGPVYPRGALRDGQEGVVGIRMIVNADGTIRTAEVASPCVWPLLNESAVRTVRKLWRFEPGEVRIFEVAIKFQITTR
jgi:protein TonB